MIYLNPNQNNSVVVTLRELSNNQVNPYYTWFIESKNTLEGIYFTADNSSNSPYYDSFTISVGLGIGLTAGKINPTTGQWRYEIWEQALPYQLSTASSTNMVETGIVIINGTWSEFATFTQSAQATINVYQNLDRI